jgi:hypothetical protein
MRVFPLLVLALPLCAQQIVYTKVFPGSVPAYVKITLTKAGAATYQEAADEEEPDKFQLDGPSAGAIFDLAAKLDHFKGKLESGLKVAKTGEKTFRWEEGAAASQASFNYTTDESARELQTWFEHITETQRILADLQRTYRYDRLGVNEILLRLDAAWLAKRVIAPDQFLSILERITKNESLLNMARDRAAALSEAIKNSTKAP